MTKKNKERVNAVKEALKLTPEESALVIIKKDHKEIFSFFFNTNKLQVLQLITSGLLALLDEALVEEKFSGEQRLFALKTLCGDLQNNYKEVYLNKFEIEEDT